jgi:Leucine Rich repeat
MPAEPASRPWRRFLRPSVRGLIVLVLAIGAGLGWIVRQAHVQRDAVAAIKRDHGVVYYDSGWTDEPTNVTVIAPIVQEPWAPNWRDYFSHVTSVKLDGAQVTDAGLVHLKGLTNLSCLQLRRTQITDAGLVHLKGLSNLSHLDIQINQVTDAGLVHLKGLSNLTDLALGVNPVTDAGMVQLKGLTKLIDLRLRATQVTDAGVDELKRSLPSLTISR